MENLKHLKKLPSLMILVSSKIKEKIIIALVKFQKAKISQFVKIGVTHRRKSVNLEKLEREFRIILNLGLIRALSMKEKVDHSRKSKVY